MKTFNVFFLDPNNNKDETQFDIEDNSVEIMMNEILTLFNDFSFENWDKPCRLLAVEETKHEE